MTCPGCLFFFFRGCEIFSLIPILGMLAYFVDPKALTPTYILVLWITSILALAWALGTLVFYHNSRPHGAFVGLVDLAIMGTLIAGVYLLHGIAGVSCSNFDSGNIYVDLGPFGYYGREDGSKWALNINKTCAMLKASFGFGIMNIFFFFMTAVAAFFLHHHYAEHHQARRVYSNSRHRSPSGRSYDYGPSSAGRRPPRRTRTTRKYYS